jgi:hypothetical protein
LFPALPPTLRPVLTAGAVAGAVAGIALLPVPILREAFDWTPGAGIASVIAGVALIAPRVA